MDAVRGVLARVRVTPDERVIVVVDGDTDVVALPVRGRETWTVVRHTDAPGAFPTRLAAVAPADLVLDLRKGRPPGCDLVPLLARVRAGGRLLLPGRSSLLFPASWGALVEAVRVADGVVEVRRSRVPVVSGVSPSDVDEVLAVRGGSGTSDRTLSRVASRVVESNALVTTNDPSFARARYPRVMRVPELRVREHLEPLAVPRQVLLRDDLVLPASWRLPRAPRIHHTGLPPVAGRVAFRPEHPDELPRLRGTYYYLDLEFNRHFGHFMTEALGRLYAWHDLVREEPRSKILVSHLRPYQEELLRAFGVPRERIRVMRRPQYVERVVAADPQFHNLAYVAPEIDDTYLRLAAGFPRDVVPAGPSRVFVAREPGLWRECVNANEVEALFASLGFVVVRPELLDLEGQVALFRDARVVAGYNGSGMYGTVFARHTVDVIGVAARAYRATNEYLFATARSHRLHQFWGDDVVSGRAVDVRGRALAPTNLDYVVDVRRLRRLVRRVLRGA